MFTVGCLIDSQIDILPYKIVQFGIIIAYNSVILSKF